MPITIGGNYPAYASDVGSTVGPRTNPFLKSITFFDWKIYYIRHRPLEKDEKKEDSPSEEDIGEGYAGNGTNDNNYDDDLTCEVNDLIRWDVML